MERGLIRITGEDDSLGRPYLYGTTRRFLEHFGIRRLDDLPFRETITAAGAPDADAPRPDREEADDPEEHAFELDEAGDQAA